MQETQTFEESIQQWYGRLPLVARIDRPYHAPEKLTLLQDCLHTSLQITTKPNTFSRVFKKVNGKEYVYVQNLGREYSHNGNYFVSEGASQNLEIVLFGRALDERNTPQLLFTLQKDKPEELKAHSTMPFNFPLRTIPLDALADYRI